ncbi:MAG: hypothetical protein EBX52_01940 [Proteobacteria bacterium]|nr:hypothetical protein [Pseudomonadota bacterium]
MIKSRTPRALPGPVLALVSILLISHPSKADDETLVTDSATEMSDAADAASIPVATPTPADLTPADPSPADPTAPSSASSARKGGSILDDPHYDPSIPWYQSIRPRWGFQIRLAPHGFPVKSGNGDLYQFGMEWLAPYQKLGIFSLGANAGFLKLYAPDTSLATTFFNPIVGGQLRYQLKFFSNQPIVPTGSLTYDYYQLKNNAPVPAHASGGQMGYSLGLMLNLSWIDPITSRGAYLSLGLTKFYLTAEMFRSKFKNGVFQLDSKFYLLGIRAEFE